MAQVYCVCCLRGILAGCWGHEQQVDSTDPRVKVAADSTASLALVGILSVRMGMLWMQLEVHRTAQHSRAGLCLDLREPKSTTLRESSSRLVRPARTCWSTKAARARGLLLCPRG